MWNNIDKIMTLVDSYDPVARQWDDPNPFFPAYLVYSSFQTVNGKLYIVGGMSQELNNGVWELDPSSPQVVKKMV